MLSSSHLLEPEAECEPLPLELPITKHGRVMNISRDGLARAAFFSDYDAVKAFLEDGRDINAKDDRGWSALAYAAGKGDYKMVWQLLSWKEGSHTANPNIQDKEGYTPLHRAITSGDEKLIKLLSAKADVNVANADGETPLHLAAEEGDVNIVDVLLRSNASIHLVDQQGRTPLHYAALCGNTEIVQALISCDSKEEESVLDASDDQGETPLHMCCSIPDASVAQVLIRAGCDVNARTAKGRTALHLATSRGCLESCRSLLRASADVNAVQSSGRTALFYALNADNNGAEMARLLISNGANRSIKDRTEHTAYEWARRKGFIELSSIIKPEEEEEESKDDVDETKDGVVV